MLSFHRAISLTVIVVFAMMSFASADAKDRYKRKYRVNVYSIKVHAAPIAIEGRSRGRVFWAGPYGMVPARSYGPATRRVFFIDGPPPRTADGQSFAMAGEGAPETVAQLCRQEATGSPEETTARLAITIDATPAQQDALAELRSTMAEAARFLRETCPTDVPLDPITRFDVLQKQLVTMRRSVEMLKPPLAKFEGSLSDQQRARLLGTTSETDRRAEGQPGVSEICEATMSITRLPTDRIARSVRPRGEQREALVHAFAETARAGDLLARNCREQLPTTPLARLEGMERQLRAASEAVEIVSAATGEFYDTLRPEQQARFDRMNTRQAMRSRAD